MLRCPHCNFLSDPKTGDIYDARFPCPKCGKRALKKPRPVGVRMNNLRAARCQFIPKGLGNFGATSTKSKLVSLLKTISFGGGFYYVYSKLSDIDRAENTRDKKLKMMLGDMLPSLKKASYFIPALALPEMMSIVTNKERPVIALVYQAGVIFAMARVASNPFLKEVAV